jgi:hypothetical protein
MNITHLTAASIRSVCIAGAVLALIGAALPQHSMASTKQTTKKTAATKAPPEASPEQVLAAEQVYYGIYDCEDRQKLNVVKNAKYAAYVDVKQGKTTYLMKPVSSPTGATRLEDLRGDTLLVQIANKSMLMNVKRGQRIVDGCTNDQQRALVESLKSKPADSADSLLAK